MVVREEKKVGPPRRYRKPNALKHGGFSQMELFPCENAAELEKLHRDLVEQYQPRGPLQEDCIQSVASLCGAKGESETSGALILKRRSSVSKMRSCGII